MLACFRLDLISWFYWHRGKKTWTGPTGPLDYFLQSVVLSNIILREKKKSFVKDKRQRLSRNQAQRQMNAWTLHHIWSLVKQARGLYSLFHDSPARRAEFSMLTGCSTFPLRFCATRWVEDLRVVERALQLLPDVTKYVNAVLKKPPSQVPKTATFVAVRDGCFDELLVCKLKFFAFELRPLKLG